MSCSNTQLLDAYVDHELDLSHSLAVESHLATCEECAQRLRALTALHQRLGSAEMRFPAPPSLRDRIGRSIASENKGLPAMQPLTMVPGGRSRRAAIWAFAAAALIVTVSLASVFAIRRRDAERALTAEVVGAHVRSLMADHLLDVPSSDQHTVKPWFHGKLNFAPHVDDLSQQGFPLVGGRLDYLHGFTVAALVYQRHQHPINVFESPASKAAAPETHTDSGFNVIHWSDEGIEYWAVSDLNQQELAQFVGLLRKR